MTNLWLEEWRHGARPQAQGRKSRFGKRAITPGTKQHLRIKAFYGTSENAVKTQIWIAVSIYVLVANRTQTTGPGG
jgi:hypothetical protein